MFYATQSYSNRILPVMYLYLNFVFYFTALKFVYQVLFSLYCGSSGLDDEDIWGFVPFYLQSFIFSARKTSTILWLIVWPSFPQVGTGQFLFDLTVFMLWGSIGFQLILHSNYLKSLSKGCTEMESAIPSVYR